jgi:PncC family amidohydrolase
VSASADLSEIDRLPDLLAGRTLGCAESCTAGSIAARLAASGDAARWFRGGIVAYQTTLKRSLLEVRAPSVLTEQAATEMAIGVTRLLDVEVALATTGVLGDEPVDGVMPGTVLVASAIGGDLRTAHHQVQGDPEERARRATDLALVHLVDHLVGSAARAEREVR